MLIFRTPDDASCTQYCDCRTQLVGIASPEEERLIEQMPFLIDDYALPCTWFCPACGNRYQRFIYGKRGRLLSTDFGEMGCDREKRIAEYQRFTRRRKRLCRQTKS